MAAATLMEITRLKLLQTVSLSQVLTMLTQTTTPRLKFLMTMTTPKMTTSRMKVLMMLTTTRMKNLRMMSPRLKEIFPRKSWIRKQLRNYRL